MNVSEESPWAVLAFRIWNITDVSGGKSAVQQIATGRDSLPQSWYGEK